MADPTIFSDQGVTQALPGDDIALVLDTKGGELAPRNAVQTSAALQPELIVHGGFTAARLGGGDYQLKVTFPDGFFGDVFLAGVAGYWVERDVDIAAGGDLTIGPINGPVTPGILRDVGGENIDLLAVLPVARTLSEADVALLAQYYARRGGVNALVFSPASLFADSDGVWSDPASSSFQDTPATTEAEPGDSVAFQLDRSEGAGYSGGEFTGLGAEIMPAGSDQAANWTLVSSMAALDQNGGKIRATASGTNARARLALSATAGSTYVYSATYDLISGLDRQLRAFISNNSGSADQALNELGPARSFSNTFQPTTSTPYAWIWLSSSDSNQVVDYYDASIRELPGHHATNGTTAQQPALGCAPVEVRNLLADSADFNDSSWILRDVTVDSGHYPDPVSGVSIDRVNAQATGGNRRLAVEEATDNVVEVGETYVLSGRFVIDDAGPVIALGTYVASGVFGWGWYDTSSGASGQTAYSAIGSFSLVGATEVAPNIWDLEIAYVPGRSDVQFGATFGSGTNLFTGPAESGSTGIGRIQVEKGSAATAYQQVTNGGLNITEEGVPSFNYLRFDGVDDSLDQVMPDGFNGDVMIFGRDGSWIDTGVTVAPGGTLTVIDGPDSVGAPGIVPVLGDIVGWVALDRPITPREQDDLLAYYAKRGAGGLYRLGPELVVNGTFDADISGWAALSGTGSATVTHVDSAIRLETASSGNGAAYSMLEGSVLEGAPIIVTFLVQSADAGSEDFRVRTGSGIPASAPSGTDLYYHSAAAAIDGDTITRVLNAPDDMDWVSVYLSDGSAGAVEVDLISIRKLVQS